MQRLCFALLLMCASFTGTAGAQTRFVVVNGQRLTDDEIAYFDRIQCARIPNGRYWLNTTTGAWGYQGIPAVQGYLGAACNGGNQQRHKSLSERGLLYTPNDLRFR